MFDFFFYGTLVDADVRQLVLGRPVPDAAVQPATLQEFQRYSVLDQPYPAAVPQPGSAIDGVVMPGASLVDAAKLTCFEGSDYEAELRRIAMAGVTGAGGENERDVWVYIASERVPRGGPGWSIDDWRSRHKPAFIEIANAWLDAISDTDLAAAEDLWRSRLQA